MWQVIGIFFINFRLTYVVGHNSSTHEEIDAQKSGQHDAAKSGVEVQTGSVSSNHTGDSSIKLAENGHSATNASEKHSPNGEQTEIHRNTTERQPDRSHEEEPPPRQTDRQRITNQAEMTTVNQASKSGHSNPSDEMNNENTEDPAETAH
ncbi:hypothetical protein CLF_108480, partial [Clonorchis sinensis]